MGDAVVIGEIYRLQTKTKAVQHLGLRSDKARRTSVQSGQEQEERRQEGLLLACSHPPDSFGALRPSSSSPHCTSRKSSQHIQKVPSFSLFSCPTATCTQAEPEQSIQFHSPRTTAASMIGSNAGSTSRRFLRIFPRCVAASSTAMKPPW